MGRLRTFRVDLPGDNVRAMGEQKWGGGTALRDQVGARLLGCQTVAQRCGAFRHRPPGEELFSRWPGPAVSPPDAFQIRRIGHCLAAILFGLVGSVIGRIMAQKDERTDPGS